MHRRNTNQFLRRQHSACCDGARQASTGGQTAPWWQGPKHTTKSIPMEKKLEILSFWANALLPAKTRAHFWHDLAPEFYNSKRTMIQRRRRRSAKLKAGAKR